jgi:hypothetical protein
MARAFPDVENIAVRSGVCVSVILHSTTHDEPDGIVTTTPLFTEIGPTEQAFFPDVIEYEVVTV